MTAEKSRKLTGADFGESPLRASKLSPPWLNFLIYVLCLMIAFTGKIGVDQFSLGPLKFLKLWLLFGLTASMISSYCLLCVSLYRTLYIKAFKFKSGALLSERYRWSLALPFVIAFTLNIAFNAGSFVAFCYIYTMLISLALSIEAYRKESDRLVHVVLLLPFSLVYFFTFGLSLVLMTAYSTKLFLL